MKKFLLLFLICFNVHAQTELDCLAQNIYFEARNQSLSGKLSVANVTKNRVKSNLYPDTYCEVVWQPKQFSWTHDGKSDRMTDKKARDHAYQVAWFFLTYEYSDRTNGSTHYHSIKVQPPWADEKKKVIQIEDHIFYKL